MRRPLSAALVCAAVATLVVPSSAAASPMPHQHPRLTGPHPCADADGFTCSTLSVPIDHRHSRGRTLDLAVAVQDKPTATRDLLVLAGGPGQPGLPYATQIAQITATLPDYRVVMIDQRGTGAGALDCPKLQQQMGEADLPPTPDAVQECIDNLGPDARFYRTTDTVADLDELRTALGDRTIAIDGISYGTYVAEQYAIQHPRRVSEVVLDSVVPDTDAEALSTTVMPATARVLRAACAARACPGDPAADLATVVKGRTDGATILNVIGEVGYGNPDYNGLPELLHQAALGDSKPLDDALASFVEGNSPPIAEYSEGLHVATYCADVNWPWRSPHVSLAQRTRALNAAARRLPESAVYPFDRYTAKSNGIVQACRQWPYAPERQPRGRMPHVPVLLLGGDRDLLTPVEWLHQEAHRIAQPTVVVVPGASHSLQLHTTAGLDAARTFLAGH